MSDFPKAIIYTKKGDAGLTSLVDGKQVLKFDLRVRAYGDVDELNSVIGVLKNSLQPHPLLYDLNPLLFRIQNHLFNAGSLLACEDEEILKKLPALNESHITWLEKQIDELNHVLSSLKEFILPGGHESSAWAHMARTTCRRAERNVAELIYSGASSSGEKKSTPQSPYQNSLIYLNRLSDFFFTAARWIHFKTELPEVKWDPKA
jgi:cob(I)alamin adenosyltransferase